MRTTIASAFAMVLYSLAAHAQAPAPTWYYCDASHAYYPYVTNCPMPWRPVAATSAASSARLRPSRQARGAGTPMDAAFGQGAADRQGWETWFSNQVGAFRAGAEYWASHRSLPVPGSCAVQQDAQWIAGCTAARERLAMSDGLRKAEPQYRAGWNSITPTASISDTSISDTSNSIATAGPVPLVQSASVASPGAAPDRQSAVASTAATADAQAFADPVAANTQLWQARSDAASNSSDTGWLGLGIFAAVIGICFYFLPSIIASSRGHHNRGAIFVMNLLLGWTFLGWVLALVWAFTSPAGGRWMPGRIPPTL